MNLVRREASLPNIQLREGAPEMDSETADSKVTTFVLSEMVLRYVIDEPVISRVLEDIERATLHHIWLKVDHDLARLRDLHDAARQQVVDLQQAALGAGLVVAQRFIVQVHSAIDDWARALVDLRKLKIEPPSKGQLMQAGRFRSPGASYTRIEQVNALANLFKHESEWGNWNTEKGLAKKTIEVARTIGAEPLGPNINVGVRAITNRNRHPLAAIGKLLHRWAKAAEWHAIRHMGAEDRRSHVRKQIAAIVAKAS